MKTPTRRQFIHAAAQLSGALSAGIVAPSVTAQDYPNKTIRWVVPYAAGGGADVLARQLLPKLGQALGQTVFIDNKVGAGGLLAAEFVAQQAADGYTMLLGASTHVTQKLLQPKASYDPIKSFAHVTRLSQAPSMLVVAAASRFKTLDDLLRAARDEPGKLNYGSGGIGGAAHLAAAALVHHARVDVAHIPYRGSVDLAAALSSGDIQFAIPTASTAVPLVQAGRLRALAVTSALRDVQMPNLPTLKELTSADELVLEAWSALWLPAGAPSAVQTRLFEVFRTALADPDIVRAHTALGATVMVSKSPAEASEFVANEVSKYARIVVNSKITVN
jgi:tripartite-type tricarboxylate transporter receptor subunit TctC